MKAIILAVLMIQSMAFARGTGDVGSVQKNAAVTCTPINNKHVTTADRIENVGVEINANAGDRLLSYRSINTLYGVFNIEGISAKEPGSKFDLVHSTNKAVRAVMLLSSNAQQIKKSGEFKIILVVTGLDQLLDVPNAKASSMASAFKCVLNR